MSIERQVGETGNKSLDLMRKLSDYLGRWFFFIIIDIIVIIWLRILFITKIV
jgi:hypothetical protein